MIPGNFPENPNEKIKKIKKINPRKIPSKIPSIDEPTPIDNEPEKETDTDESIINSREPDKDARETYENF